VASNHVGFARSATRSVSLANWFCTIGPADYLFTLTEFLFAAALQLAQNNRCGVLVNSQLLHGHYIAADALDPMCVRPLDESLTT
jgi:hypothetical protein